MITVLPMVSRAYEICIPFHHTESQISEVTDAKNVRRHRPISPFTWGCPSCPHPIRFRVRGWGWAGLDGHTVEGTDEAGRCRRLFPDAYVSTVRVIGGRIRVRFVPFIVSGSSCVADFASAARSGKGPSVSGRQWHHRLQERRCSSTTIGNIGSAYGGRGATTVHMHGWVP
jgi:hypothetical protein